MVPQRPIRRRPGAAWQLGGHTRPVWFGCASRALLAAEIRFAVDSVNVAAMAAPPSAVQAARFDRSDGFAALRHRTPMRHIQTALETATDAFSGCAIAQTHIEACPIPSYATRSAT